MADALTTHLADMAKIKTLKASIESGKLSLMDRCEVEEELADLLERTGQKIQEAQSSMDSDEPCEMCGA